MSPVPMPPQAVLDRFFPAVRPGPAEGVFELGLVLGGTVSAGAYTAGALDFFLEALEAWHAQTRPPHQVRIPFVAGASGGAICAAILGLLSRKSVPHITGMDSPYVRSTAPSGNKLWDIWVNEIDVSGLLATDDLGAGPIESLINCRPLDRVIDEMAAFGRTTGDFDRPYFPAPYRMAVTLGNMRGIPFRLDVPGFDGWDGAAFLAHDDFARFAIPNGASPAAEGEAGKRPDEFWVDPGLVGQGADFVGYDAYALFAAGSAAFPVGLKARALSRPAEHYLYRPYVQPRQSGYRVDWPNPDWANVLDPGSTRYAFTAIDGGTFNNDPMQLVHRALAGLVGENPRDPATATRALFMVDPLATRPARVPAVPTDLMGVVARLLGTMTEGTRYLTADMALLGDPKVFSRYQLVPSRPDLGLLGEEALTTAHLMAFAGFCARGFRVHDFLLGRINMQQYLRTELMLRGDNPLFAGWTDPALRSRFALDGENRRVSVTTTTDPTTYDLPVIPDLSYDGEGPIAALPNTQMLPWPTGALDPARLRDAVDERIGAVIDALREQEMPGAISWALGGMIEPAIARNLTGRLIDGLTASLRRAKLL